MFHVMYMYHQVVTEIPTDLSAPEGESSPATGLAQESQSQSQAQFHQPELEKRRPHSGSGRGQGARGRRGEAETLVL